MEYTSSHSNVVAAVITAIAAIGAALIAKYGLPTSSSQSLNESTPVSPPNALPITKNNPIKPTVVGTWVDVNLPQNMIKISQNGASFDFNGQGVDQYSQTAFRNVGHLNVVGSNLSMNYWVTMSTGATSTGQCSGVLAHSGVQMSLTCYDIAFGSYRVMLQKQL